MFNLFRQGRTYVPEVEPPVVREEVQQPRICRSAGPNEIEFEELPRFGPLYSKYESDMSRGYKEEAWERVLVKTGGDKSEITENYLSAIGEVEREAVDCYEDVSMVESETEFRWMMLKDGCFLIQLVILILGGSYILAYPKNHVIFGRSKKHDMKLWLRSLFYVGNQIPLVVLWKLMEQPFFQDLIAARVWKEPSDFLKKVLYELLILPYTGKRNSHRLITFPTAMQGPILATSCQLPIQRSSDLLHSLHSFVTGTAKNPTKLAKMEDDIDLELGDIEDVVDDSDIDDVDDDNDIEDVVDDSDIENVVDDDKEFLSATKLVQAGISFKNVERMGCRGIYFDPGLLSPVVFMPTLTVDDTTELMFQSLKRYEMTQQTSRRGQEVCAHLKFMSELIQTTEDVKILAYEGIIKGDPEYKEKLPQILSRLAECESSKNLWRLRLQINEYSRPAWLKYKGILSTAFLLTILQTVFTILSYTHDL